MPRDLTQLSPAARSGLLKVLGGFKFMIPSRTLWDEPSFAEEAERYCKENKLTAEEEAELRKAFPNGLFG